ncbi:protein phosphatase 1 regulatory subunit 3C-B-like [Brachyhypopomus gauderio]|uniref:protein phosphatase 1 regulatory subunit 3C-B-like n=1 Tax=Brachyhypopomus gauderio TaxID=698409 RepID=UPI0040411A8C
MSAAKVMPVDLAMHAHVNRRHPVSQILTMPPQGVHHTLWRHSTPSNALHPFRTVPRHPFSPTNTLAIPGKGAALKKKKRVVFADAKGLALTAVRLFSIDPPVSDPEDPSPPATPKEQGSVRGQILRLRLGFLQPSADVPSFLAGLAESLVRLESCSLMGRSLSGTVRVCNVSARKAVHIHITFDSWRSRWDVPCVRAKQQQHGDSETDVFVFTVPLLHELSILDQLEFCVSFRPGLGNVTLWDNNGGQNYRVTVEPVNPEEVPMVWNKLLVAEQSTLMSQEPSSNCVESKLP